MGCVPASSGGAQCENCCDCTPCPVEQAKPEVLPWRTRLKTRIGDRLFHRGDGSIQPCCGEEKSDTANHPVVPAPFPAAPPNLPDKPSVPEKSPPSAETTDLQMPKADLSQPESKRPDLVME